jgi:CBS domain-containing protein
MDAVQMAANVMETVGIGFVPVCDEFGRVVGTLTDRDIAVRCVAHDLPASTPVRDVMTKEVVACNQEENLERAEQLMSDNQKSRIMCLDNDGQLVGVISLSDLPQHASRKRVGEVLERVSEREVHRSH